MSASSGRWDEGRELPSDWVTLSGCWCVGRSHRVSPATFRTARRQRVDRMEANTEQLKISLVNGSPDGNGGGEDNIGMGLTAPHGLHVLSLEPWYTH